MQITNLPTGYAGHTIKRTIHSQSRPLQPRQPVPPRFGLGIVEVGIAAFLTSYGFFLGMAGAAIATLEAAFLGLIVSLVVSKCIPELGQRLSPMIREMKAGNFELLSRTDQKAVDGRTERQTRFRVGDKQYTFFEVTADSREKRFFGGTGKSMVHYKLTDDAGNLRIEYTERPENKKQKRVLIMQFDMGTEICKQDKALPKNVAKVFEMLQRMIAASQTAATQKPLALFSIHPQLLDCHEIQPVPVRQETAPAFEVEDAEPIQTQQKMAVKEAGR